MISTKFYGTLCMGVMHLIVYKDVIGRLKQAGYNSGRILRERLLPQSTMDALRHNRPVNLTTIDSLCRVLQCQPGDILEYRETPEE